MKFRESEVNLAIVALQDYAARLRAVGCHADDIADLANRFVAGEAKPYLPEPQPTLFDEPKEAPIDATRR